MPMRVGLLAKQRGEETRVLPSFFVRTPSAFPELACSRNPSNPRITKLRVRISDRKPRQESAGRRSSGKPGMGSRRSVVMPPPPRNRSLQVEQVGDVTVIRFAASELLDD